MVSAVMLSIVGPPKYQARREKVISNKHSILIYCSVRMYECVFSLLNLKLKKLDCLSLTHIKDCVIFAGKARRYFHLGMQWLYSQILDLVKIADILQ
jgi:hypothetical protein